MVTFAAAPGFKVPATTNVEETVTVKDSFGAPIVDQTVVFSPSGSQAGSCTPGLTLGTDSTGSAKYVVGCSVPATLDVAMVVTTQNGTQYAAGQTALTYFGVSSVSPSAGSPAGGTSVTILGAGFTGATKVQFGTGNPASSFTVVSSTKITAVSPPHAAGTPHVFVTTTGGTTLASNGDRFTYEEAPTVTAISPSSGPASGGTSVTITGTNFTAATKVQFGTGNLAPSFTVVSATKITAVSPAHAIGTPHVFVTTPVGMSVAGNADKFTYKEPLPAVTGVSPKSGPAAGGATVVLTGTGFTGATQVEFGSGNPVAAGNFTVNSPTQITVTSTPSHAANQVNVFVTTSAGRSVSGSATHYTYTAG